jgi:Tfp pilus assembly protein PilX
MQIVSMLTKTGRGGRRKERGAALITTLMMSTLLLTAGGALILTTAMSVTNAYDSTSETQAYYAAEAGLQATLNVLRGNVSPALTYRDAITPANSNAASDPATTAATPWARLSKWLTYDANFPDRVILTTPYSPLSGSAFSSVHGRQ